MSFSVNKTEITHGKVMEELISSNPLIRMRGISHAAWINDTSADCIERLELLKSDDSYDTLTKISVSDFAYAALDVLKIERYSGDKALVQNLISCGLNCE